MSAGSRAATLSGDFKGHIELQLYTLRESFKTDVPGTLDKVKALGLVEIEGGGDYGLGLEKFNALLQERGLKMVSAGFGYDGLKKDIGAAVRRAQSFGVKFVMCAAPRRTSTSGARRSRRRASPSPIIRTAQLTASDRCEFDDAELVFVAPEGRTK